MFRTLNRDVILSKKRVKLGSETEVDFSFLTYTTAKGWNKATTWCQATQMGNSSTCFMQISFKT